MHRRMLAVGAVSLAVSGILAALPRDATAARSVASELQFVNHIQADLPEQDVFVQRSGTPEGKVVRLEPKDVKAGDGVGNMTYAAGAPVPHDPFKLSSSPLGPYDQGRPLGFNLKQWLDGTATGSYTTDGVTAELQLSMRNLVPNGVYTVWCSRLSFPPNFNVVDTPCGSADGSRNAVRADAQGNASFALNGMKPLPDSSKQTATVIALAYHSDGKTYGPTPGDFGTVSHVQLFAMLPEASPSGLPNTGDAGGPSYPAAAAALGGSLLLAGLVIRRRLSAHVS